MPCSAHALVILTGLGACQANNPIPSVEAPAGLFDYAQSLELTNGFQHPLILKSWADVSAFADVCNCTETSFFEGAWYPWTPGQPKTKMQKGVKAQRKDFGWVYSERMCQGHEDYIFFGGELVIGLNHRLEQIFTNISIEIGAKSKFLNTDILPPLATSNEMFVGWANNAYAEPGDDTAGAGVHHADVHNFYVQICGSKHWWIAPRGSEMDIQAHDNSAAPSNAAFMAHPEVQDGFTHPGDVMFNPPLLWHYLRASKGFNLAVAWKQIGSEIRKQFDDGPLPELYRPRPDWLERGEVLPTRDSVLLNFMMASIEKWGHALDRPSFIIEAALAAAKTIKMTRDFFANGASWQVFRLLTWQDVYDAFFYNRKEIGLRLVVQDLLGLCGALTGVIMRLLLSLGAIRASLFLRDALLGSGKKTACRLNSSMHLAACLVALLLFFQPCRSPRVRGGTSMPRLLALLVAALPASLILRRLGRFEHDPAKGFIVPTLFIIRWCLA